MTGVSAGAVLAQRMSSLLLSAPANTPSNVAELVTWFGGMQAQDLGSGLWSLGCRLPGWTKADVEAALERREALRTWPMRGTVHFVPTVDARWMVEILGERPLAAAKTRRAFLGLSESIADQAVEVLGAALAGGNRLTRAECVAALKAAGLKWDGQVGYHLLWYASQRGVSCIAPNIGSEQTFALLDEWAPTQVQLGREEALATIALRYFRSHGPTTRQDFAGWAGITAADAKRGIAANGDALASADLAGIEVIFAADVLDFGSTEPADDVFAVAGFDEYLLGFKDRSLMIADEHKQAIVPGSNGIFQWTIVRAGRVIGTWKRTVKRTALVVDVTAFSLLSKGDRSHVEAALEPYGRFVGLPVETRWT